MLWSWKQIWEVIVQVCIPGFTILGFFLVSIKMPEYGVIVSLISQIFWLYSAHKAWREANQWGMFVNTVLATMIFAFGVLNYWLF